MKRDGHYPYQVPIDSYGNGGFLFADMSHKGSLFCLPSGMHAWNISSYNAIGTDSFGPVLQQADQIDVLLLGQGIEISFLAPQLRQLFKEHLIIVEATATGSAISTYNILLGEKRAVAAALVSVDHLEQAK